MDNLLQRRLLGLVVILGALLLLSWLIPAGHSPSTTADTTTISVDEAARLAQGHAPTLAVHDNTAPTVAAVDKSSAAPASAASAASEHGGQPAAASSVAAPPALATPSPTPAAATAQTGSSAPAPAAAPAAAATSLPSTAAKVSEPPPAASVASTAHPPAASPASKPQPAAPSSSASAPAAHAPPTPPPAPKVASTPKSATKPTAKGGWYVQVGSFSTSGKAQTVSELLHNAGFAPDVSSITVGGKGLYRVRVGPFASTTAADEALGKIQHQGYPDARRVAE